MTNTNTRRYLGRIMPDGSFLPANTKWCIVQCDPDESGADSVRQVIGLFDTEDEALDILANIRDDDPDTGDGWTYMPIINMEEIA